LIRARLVAGGLAGSLALVALPACAAAASPPRGFFGVAPQGPLQAADFEAMGAAGVGTLRFGLDWSRIEPVPGGGYDWGVSDALVAGAAAGGIRALPFVFGAPAWAIALDGHRCGRRGCPPYAPHGPAALAAWGGLLTAAVRRYGPRGAFWAENPGLPRLPVRDWQIWNEQNSPSYWAPRPSVPGYARLLRAAHSAIRAADPDAKVLLGGMFASPLGGQRPAIAATRFLARLYRRSGARRNFEGVAAHPYSPSVAGVRSQVGALRELMDAAGDTGTPLWVTELGWASGGPANPLNRGLAGQAANLRRAFSALIRDRRALRLAGVTWYSWRDNPDVQAGLCAWCPESGLVEADGTAKPALAAFAELAGGR
jgi:hypothetical protein